MSKHPIPDWLRSQFSLIEDEVRKLGPCGVFTQMRTVTQTYFEQQVAAPQPPALGGELCGLISLMRNAVRDDASTGGREYFEKAKTAESNLRAHLAALQAEIERQRQRTVRACQVAIERSQQKKAADAEVIRLKARCDELECDHEWTDDGEFNLHCTKCGKQENHEPYGWVQTRGNAINHFTQEWDVVEEWEAQGFEYKAMFDAALSKPAGSEQP
ncbi:hypothetical protein ACTACV_10140 [Pseudomonas syringae]|uniref:hypothetical protein n=1 Tax=Pseudomonas syringae TaxID=317 RepID=UPI003F74D0F9